jgi:hypothetical protein
MFSQDDPWWIDGSRFTGDHLWQLLMDRNLESLQRAFDEVHHDVADREIGEQWTGKNRQTVERHALMVANMIATLRMVIKDAGGLA